MKYKAYILPLFFACLLVGSYSCLGDDDDINIDEEWKYMNEKAFADLALVGDNDTDTLYTKLASIYTNGLFNVKWRASDTIIKSDEPKIDPRIDSEGKPQFSDTVSVRYEGWFFTKDGEKYIFDSTENPTYGSSTNPNKISRKFAVNAVVQGWTTLLQDMKKGEEREVWIPWQLGYGSVGSGAIPGYTTLRFRILLEDIIPLKGKN